MKKYVNILDLALPYLLYMGLGTWENSEHRLHIVSRAWKNSEFSPFIWAWDLEKFHARASSWALGLGKISIFIYRSTYMEIGSGILSPASI